MTTEGLALARRIALERAAEGDSSMMRGLTPDSRSRTPLEGGDAMMKTWSGVHFEYHTAKGSAVTQVQGYDRATALAELEVTLGGQVYAHSSSQNGPYTIQDDQSPAYYVVSAPVQAFFQRSCGLLAVINGYHEAWYSTGNGQAAPRTSFSSAEQPACECSGDPQDSLDAAPSGVARLGRGPVLQRTDCAATAVVEVGVGAVGAAAREAG